MSTTNLSNRHLAAHARDFWLARGAILLIAILQLAIVNDLSMGPHWLAPAVELALLIPLSIGTAWTVKRARHASSEDEWLGVHRTRKAIRWLAVALTAISTLMNFAALARLIAAMLTGKAGGGQTLLLDAVNIWVTNLVIFALWFWTIDRGGPASRGLTKNPHCDFLFTQQQPGLQGKQFEDWSPGFIDYLFLAFTNATAFSPADTFPLTARAKLMMMAESATSLVTIAIVASRAVGILS